MACPIRRDDAGGTSSGDASGKGRKIGREAFGFFPMGRVSGALVDRELRACERRREPS
jgi:hypothetical protein